MDYMHYNTNTGLALEKAYDRFKTKGRKGRKFPKILFVVTDGVSSDPKKLPGKNFKVRNLYYKETLVQATILRSF